MRELDVAQPALRRSPAGQVKLDLVHVDASN
jgi:hypothetical protein